MMSKKTRIHKSIVLLVLYAFGARYKSNSEKFVDMLGCKKHANNSYSNFVVLMIAHAIFRAAFVI